MGGLTPGEQAEHALLEFEDDSYARIEAAEIIRHGGDIKVRPLRKGGCLVVWDDWSIGAGIVVGWDNLLEEPVG